MSKATDSALVKRVAAAAAVVSSYYLLFLALQLGTFESRLIPILVAVVVMIASVLVLRSATHRITTLDDDQLDEREVEVRNWAFRTGYLVVRRVGLALVVVSGIITVAGLYVLGSPLQSVYDATANYLHELVGQTPWVLLTLVIGLLTYVAYSFPLVLIAWRDAKNSPID